MTIKPLRKVLKPLKRKVEKAVTGSLKGLTNDDRLDLLFSMVNKPPEKWTEEEMEKKISLLEPQECTTYKQLNDAWRVGLKWTEALDCTLSAILSTVLSTCFFGDQIWLRVVGPPGSAKSTLCEAISLAKRWIYPISMQTGFHSGYKVEGGDASLIPRMNNKTVVIKDGDTLLNSSNLGQTLAELRDIYDGVSRAAYRNAQEKNYENLKITFIVAGTKSLIRLNRSYLGDRFIDCVIYDRANEQNEELEEEIVNRAAFNALTRLRLDDSSQTNENKGMSEEMVHAYRLTAGYVEYLRLQGPALMKQVEFTSRDVMFCKRLGEFVSYMRARPDDEQIDEDQQEVELATRLASQMVRLANCMLVVLNKPKVDDDVRKRLRKIATNTGRGLSLTIVKELLKGPDNGLDVQQIARRIRKSDTVVRNHCYFLNEIGVLTRNEAAALSGTRGRNRHLWALTYKIRTLANLVVLEEEVHEV